MKNRLILAAMLVLAMTPTLASASRVKDLVEIQGVRENELFGYGLVVGLAGTGDTERVFFTQQSVSGMLGRLGIRVDPREVRVRNVAAVMVTARLPPFARPGTKIDVTVGSLGNARSLAGGVLMITPLTGADGAVYALAQGGVQVGGFEASARGSSIRKNQATAGRIPSGAMVERAVTVDLAKGPLLLELNQPDFTNANRIATAINSVVAAGLAKALDPAAVEVTLKEGVDIVDLLAKIEAVDVETDRGARVVVSERSGTVVAGDRVRIRPAAVAHGGLSITISDRPVISQPSPFSSGRTTTERTADIESREGAKGLVALPATTTVDELAKALNTLGATPRDLVEILQALKLAGALDAEIEVL